jgi:hypothetical protein
MLAQVNGYARVAGISDTELYIAEHNEAFGQFDSGDLIILMQMQDDAIGSTDDNADFGDLGDIRMAGRYEVCRIASVTRIAGLLDVITLNAAPTIPYNFGENASVQAITLELLGAGGDHTTTAAIDALPWNGFIGGVVAIEVAGTLDLKHPIRADGAGFRGGAADQTAAGTCEFTTFRSVKTNRFAYKGEGIHRNTNANWEAARGRILNGGGGGNDHNGGGGGGGNYTGGGLSGPGYGCGAGHAGGFGGLGLGGVVSADRVFMGGGGGGGEGNDNVATNGARGGGIVLIKAASLVTSGSCSNVVISANGANAGNAGNDGAGGGGAGGSIIIHSDEIDFVSGCPVTIRVNGGNGGSANHSQIHGGGGGGGQGVIIFSNALPAANASILTNNGNGGCNNNSNPCNSAAANGSGSNGSGILAANSPLPVELISFQAIPVGKVVHLTWTTASENGNRDFIVERSTDLALWDEIDQVPGMGTTHTITNYRTVDDAPLPRISYYRLRQTDHDGATTWSDVVSVRMEERDSTLEVFPNPANEQATALFSEHMEGGMLFVLNDLGQRVKGAQVVANGRALIDLRDLGTGHYTVVLVREDRVLRARLIVQR